MEQGQSEESLIESGERSDVGRRRNTPAGELEEGKLPRSVVKFRPYILFVSVICFPLGYISLYSGDRMWHFAIGLYLVELTPGSLRLTAIYQLISTLSIIIFGPLVGDWVDGTPRLKVAQISLIIQNVAVIICGVLLLIMLKLEEHIQHPYTMLLEANIIIIGSVADLSSVGTKIAVEKDWVVVIAGSDKSLLASTNALMRRIDLCCKILAPIVVGQVMTYISKMAGVLFLAGWNVVSVFGEYYLLWTVFKAVAALSHKVIDTTRHNSNTEDNSSVDMSADEPHGSNERLERMENEDQERGQNGAEVLVPAVTVRPVQRQPKPSVYARFKKRILTFEMGWHIYFRQSVARPGLALASLYFTVISFGAITTGYAYTQCLSESVLSLIRGIGSLFGVFATFVFPRLRNAVGVVRCGLFSMSLQFSCLLLCVAAVFAPGSPFFLLPRNSGQPLLPQCKAPQQTTPTPTLSPSCIDEGPRNSSLNVHPSNLQFMRRDVDYSNTAVTTARMSLPSVTVPSVVNRVNGSKTQAIPSTTAILPSKTTPSVVPSNSVVSPSTSSPSTRNCSLKTTASMPQAVSNSFSYVSISLLLAGIVSSRLGLWLSDLTITQLTQEAVPEQERGIVGGMQNSFNSILSLLMFCLVIALPKPETFGLLALMSVGAVGTGGLLYASFAYKIRGHLFHFEKARKFCGGADARREPVPMLISNDDLDLEDDEEEAMIRGVLSTRNENFKY